MNKRKEFLILLLGVIITRLADVIGTYHYTPDLAKEANPMVSLFGMGWTYVLLATISGVIFSAGLNYYSLFMIRPLEVSTPDLNKKQYLSMLFLNKIVEWRWVYLLKTDPFGKNQTFYMYGWVIPRILINVGIVIIIFHCLLAFVPGYASIHKYFFVPMYLLIIGCIPYTFLNYYQYRYKKYLSLNSKYIKSTVPS